MHSHFQIDKNNVNLSTLMRGEVVSGNFTIQNHYSGAILKDSHLSETRKQALAVLTSMMNDKKMQNTTAIVFNFIAYHEERNQSTRFVEYLSAM